MTDAALRHVRPIIASCAAQDRAVFNDTENWMTIAADSAIEFRCRGVCLSIVTIECLDTGARGQGASATGGVPATTWQRAATLHRFRFARTLAQAVAVS